MLGPVMERSLGQALTIAGGDVRGLWDSPIAATLLLAAAVALLATAMRGVRGSTSGARARAAGKDSA